ncbi:MAG: helix-turn-helix transcriptional regulator [Phycisphaerales bacterium]|nr:helix-turn-helix transcriptional regulator [Phycisphaerales bacterium]
MCKIDPIDQEVGSRMRFRRNCRNLSQSALSEMVGISFQQIQKYESGANRISASRMVQLANALKVPAGFFLEGLGEFDDEQIPVGLMGVAGTKVGAGVIRDFQNMSREQQSALGQVATAIVN